MKKLILITAVLFLCTHSVQAAQNSEATVHIDVDTVNPGIQTSRTATAGEIFDVDIVIKGAGNLKIFNLVVSFPEAVLAIQEDGVTKGDFFPGVFTFPILPYSEEPITNWDEKVFFIRDLSRPGKAQVTGIIMPNDDVVSGDGALFRLKFKVLSTEPANLQFLADDTQILQDNTGVRPEAIDDPVALENANGAAINRPAHLADTGGDYMVGDFELLDYIDQWANGQVDDFDLLDTIDLWAAGHYYWDVTAQKFKPGAQP